MILAPRRLGGFGPAQRRPDPGFEHGRGHRLDHVVVGARLQAPHDVGVVAPRGQHDHGHRGPARTQPSADLEAVDAGQHQVEHGEFDGRARRVGEEGEGVLTGGGRGDVVAVPAQHQFHAVAHGHVVLDQQYMGHAADYA